MPHHVVSTPRFSVMGTTKREFVPVIVSMLALVSTIDETKKSVALAPEEYVQTRSRLHLRRGASSTAYLISATRRTTPRA